MKKIALLLSIFASVNVAHAGFEGPSPTTNISTVQEAKEMSDDAMVTLEGNIVKEIKKEHYIFKDATGKIEIEIDDKDFTNVKVTPNDTVRITGEVDEEWSTTTIDVDTIVLVK